MSRHMFAIWVSGFCLACGMRWRPVTIAIGVDTIVATAIA
jgi:hypothetical protein